MRNQLALALAAIPFALHLAALNEYGFFRDELYFIVCGRHPAFGYVDQPPLIPLLAAASQSAGESLWLIRIIPALFAVGAVLAACATARILGGGRGAQILAGLATGSAPLLLGITATLSTSAIEPLTWTLIGYGVLRAVLRAEPRWWIVAGLVAGIALEAKYTVAFFLVALVTALALAGPRSVFARGEFWLGTGITVAIAAPSLIWQALHGWPFLELLRAGANGKNVALAPLPWLLQQALIYTPAYALIGVAGVIGLMAFAPTRFMGLSALALVATFMLLHAKDYYLAGLYPLLFAAGGVALERAIRSVAIRTAYASIALAGALCFAPLALPLLPEPALVAYQRQLSGTLHIALSDAEHHQRALLPQTFADMHGWRELADRVNVVERSLSPADRAQAAIFTQNYGEAGAIDVFGDGVLDVLCAHNNYFLWGPRGTPRVLIIVGGDKRDHERVFRDVHQVELVRSTYAMPYENDLPIFVARDPKADLGRLWPTLRHYD